MPARDPEKKKAYDVEYNKRRDRAKVRAQVKARKKADPEKYRKKEAEYAANFHEKNPNYMKEWIAKNKEKWKAAQKRYRDKKKKEKLDLKTKS